MDVSVKIEGMNDVLKNIKAYELQLKADIKKLLNKYALKIAATAKKNLRRAGLPGIDEGRLRNSIMPYLESFALSARIETNVDYAIYVHEGTGSHATGERLSSRMFVGMKANPFMIDAWNEHIKDFHKDLTALTEGRT